MKGYKIRQPLEFEQQTLAVLHSTKDQKKL